MVHSHKSTVSMHSNMGGIYIINSNDLEMITTEKLNEKQ